MKVNELLVKVVISIGVLMKVKKIYEKMKIEKMILVTGFGNSSEAVAWTCSA